MPRRLAPEQRSIIVGLLRERTLSQPAIARRVRVSPTTVLAIAREIGVSSLPRSERARRAGDAARARGVGLPEAWREAAIEDFRRGEPFGDIRRRYGISTTTATKLRRVAGVPPRPRRRPLTADQLQAWLDRRGWSVYRLAKELETPVSTVQQWLTDGPRRARIPPMLPLALETLERRAQEARP